MRRQERNKFSNECKRFMTNETKSIEYILKRLQSTSKRIKTCSQEHQYMLLQKKNIGKQLNFRKQKTEQGYFNQFENFIKRLIMIK